MPCESDAKEYSKYILDGESRIFSDHDSAAGLPLPVFLIKHIEKSSDTYIRMVHG